MCATENSCSKIGRWRAFRSHEPRTTQSKNPLTNRRQASWILLLAGGGAKSITGGSLRDITSGIMIPRSITPARSPRIFWPVSLSFDRDRDEPLIKRHDRTRGSISFNHGKIRGRTPGDEHSPASPGGKGAVACWDGKCDQTMAMGTHVINIPP